MDATSYIAKFSQLIFLIITALTACSYPACCEGSQIGINEELPDKQYQKHIKEFQSAFGKQMEREFNLKWIKIGFLCDFSWEKFEFYAYRRATLEEARALALAVMNKLAEAIRADQKMLSYLNSGSLTPDSISVNIRFVNAHEWSYDDSIDSVSSYPSQKDISDFKKVYLRYNSIDPFRDFLDHNNSVYISIVESFEDAVNLNAATSIINPAIHKPKKFEIELDQILTSFQKEMEKKYGLIFQEASGIATYSNSHLSEICTNLIYPYPAECQDARELMLLVTKRLLTVLNNSEILKLYLKEYPFSESRLKLRILFRKEKCFVGDVPYNEGMESIELSENTITYFIGSLMHRVVYAKESYQEAQKIFDSRTPLTLYEKVIKRAKKCINNFRPLWQTLVYIFYMVFFFSMLSGGWFFLISISLLFIIIIIIFFSLWRRA